MVNSVNLDDTWARQLNSGARYAVTTGVVTGSTARTLVASLAALAVLALPVPALATTEPPSPPTTTSAADLKAQVAQEHAQVQAAQQSLAQASAQATQALEAYSKAQQVQAIAQTERLAAEHEADVAAQTVGDKQRAMSEWAVKAYQHGSGMAPSPVLETLLNGTQTDRLASDVHTLTTIGDYHAELLHELQAAEEIRAQAAHRTQAAARRANAAMQAARDLKTQRDAAVQQQRDLVAELQEQLAATVSAADQARNNEDQTRRLATARAYASQLRPGGNKVTGQVGACQGGDTSVYANGQIPVAALCELWGAPGNYLRADSAYAFNQLSTEYAKTFGQPICVTDSYRTLDEQIELARTKPNLAARAGTSNHGWGTATDLCGGIQSFGTTQHLWMQLHAPTYGWFHPAWAEPGGGKPEPWHWEFGG